MNTYEVCLNKSDFSHIYDFNKRISVYYIYFYYILHIFYMTYMLYFIV